MKTLPLLAPCALAIGFMLGGCADLEEDDGYRVHRRVAVYDDDGGSVDFYYTSGRPYSRSYGPLVARDGRYYYSRGGRYVVYDRPTTVVRRDALVVRRDVTVPRDGDGDRRRVIYADPRYDDATDSRLSDRPVRRTNVYRDDRLRGDAGVRVHAYGR